MNTMGKYDITVITRNKETLSEVSKLVEGQGGKVVETRDLGERQLAYPIAKETRGYYGTLIVELVPQKVGELSKSLGLSETVLRSLVLHYQPLKPIIAEPPAQVLTKPQPTPIAVAPSQPKPTPPEPAKPKLKAPAKLAPKKALKKAAAKPAKPELSEQERMKVLEEKLKELLKE